MATEFKKRAGELDELSSLVGAIKGSTEVKRSAWNRALELAKALEQAAEAFRKKRLETIEEEVDGMIKVTPKYYGPKMAEKVLEFETKVAVVLQDWTNIDGSTLRFVEDKGAESDASSRAIPVHKSDQVPVIGLPTSQGPVVVQLSQEELRRKQEQLERENAEKAQIALAAVEQVMVEDPLTIEQQAFAQLNVVRGLSGFQAAIALVDGGRKKSLGAILGMIYKHPENAQFRTLSLANSSVVELLEGHGVKQALGSLGFRPQMMKLKDSDAEAVAYFLPEPSVEHDFDAWSTWYEDIKNAQQSCA